ncbi:MAG: sulfite exporter TauE/SafE family protein [Dehalococcoidia bacterium]
MGILEVIGLACAAFAAGSINAVAGGGSLVSFPALLAAGYPAKTANVTNNIAVWPGFVGGSFAYRGELAGQRRRILTLLPAVTLGALAGSALLLATSGDAFDAIVPFLLIFGAALTLFNDSLSRFAQHHQLGSRSEDHVPVALHALLFAGAIYGAYFGAGLSIIMFGLLTILLPDNVHNTNALKGVLAVLINGVGVVYFGLFGPVEWAPALLMAVFALAGGYLGVGVARKLGPVWLRRGVVVAGVVVAGVLLVT